MIALICFVLAVLASPFKSKSRLEAENAVLRHQLIVLQRKVRGGARLTNNDRWFFVQMYRWLPSILKVVTIIEPGTLVRWHRAGFRRYWRWKSRSRGGRPQINVELRALIRQMGMENLLWGAPRIHGELLKLGFEVAQSTVAKYMVRRRGPPSQGWRTFLRNHAPDIAVEKAHANSWRRDKRTRSPRHTCSRCRGLGARHVSYGVRDEHYDTVGQASIWTLEKDLGNAFTPQVKSAWLSAYGLLAGVMKDAAQKTMAAQA